MGTTRRFQQHSVVPLQTGERLAGQVFSGALSGRPSAKVEVKDAAVTQQEAEAGLRLKKIHRGPTHRGPCWTAQEGLETNPRAPEVMRRAKSRKWDFAQ